MNHNKEFEGIEFVENTDKPWTPKYSHQKIKDQESRIKGVIPYHRLNKKSNTGTFTTDIPTTTKRFKPKN